MPNLRMQCATCDALGRITFLILTLVGFVRWQVEKAEKAETREKVEENEEEDRRREKEDERREKEARAMSEMEWM